MSQNGKDERKKDGTLRKGAETFGLREKSNAEVIAGGGALVDVRKQS